MSVGFYFLFRGVQHLVDGLLGGFAADDKVTLRLQHCKWEVFCEMLPFGLRNVDHFRQLTSSETFPGESQGEKQRFDNFSSKFRIWYHSDVLVEDINEISLQFKFGLKRDHVVDGGQASQRNILVLGGELLDFRAEVANNSLFFGGAELMPEDLAVLKKLEVVVVAGEDEFDIGGDLRGQPELGFNFVALGINAEIDSFDDDDHFGNLLFLVAEILLLQEIRGDVQPVFEVPSEFLLIEIDFLFYFEVILDKGRGTRSSIMVL